MKGTTHLNFSQTGWRYLVVVMLFILNLPTIAAPATGVVRERLLFDSGWRFTRGDPAGTGDELSYTNIKPWVMATGNEFVVDGKPTARPPGNLGDQVAYTRAGYDDS